MSFGHGKATKVLIDQFDLSAYFRSTTKTTTIETAESTTYGKSFKTYLTGLGDGMLSLEGLFDGSADAIDEEVAARLGQDNDVLATVGIAGAFSVGGPIFVIAGKITSFEVASPVGDVVTSNLEIQANEGAKTGRSLHDFSAQSSSTNGTSVDNGAATSTGFLALLHVVTNTRNGTFDIKIQDSADNSSWADLTTFTQIGATTVGKEAKRGTGDVRRYLRAVTTIAGTTGSVTFQVGLARL